MPQPENPSTAVRACGIQQTRESQLKEDRQQQDRPQQLPSPGGPSCPRAPGPGPAQPGFSCALPTSIPSPCPVLRWGLRPSARALGAGHTLSSRAGAPGHSRPFLKPRGFLLPGLGGCTYPLTFDGTSTPPLHSSRVLPLTDRLSDNATCHHPHHRLGCSSNSGLQH